MKRRWNTGNDRQNYTQTDRQAAKQNTHYVHGGKQEGDTTEPN